MENNAERIARLEHSALTLKATVDDHEARIRLNERLRFMVISAVAAASWVLTQVDALKGIIS